MGRSASDCAPFFLSDKSDDRLLQYSCTAGHSAWGDNAPRLLRLPSGPLNGKLLSLSLLRNLTFVKQVPFLTGSSRSLRSRPPQILTATLCPFSAHCRWKHFQTLYLYLNNQVSKNGQTQYQYMGFISNCL